MKKVNCLRFFFTLLRYKILYIHYYQTCYILIFVYHYTPLLVLIESLLETAQIFNLNLGS